MNNQSVKEEIKCKIKDTSKQIIMETVYQKLWDAAKAVWGGKFIVINADIKKIERSQ